MIENVTRDCRFSKFEDPTWKKKVEEKKEKKEEKEQKRKLLALLSPSVTFQLQTFPRETNRK